MSACQWILWGPDSIWLLTHTGPATTRHTHRPLHSIPPFPSDIGCHGDISQPVGMVTLPSPSQVTLAHPSTLPGGFCECLMRMCVCVRILIWHFSKPCGAVPQLPSLYLGRLSSSSISSVTRFIFSQLLIDVWLVREDYKLFAQSMHKII